METKKYTWIRLVYLYLMTGIGLVVFIIGSVSLINIGLKVLIFKQADADYYRDQPSPIYLEKQVGQVEELKSCQNLTASDRQLIGNWLTDYQTWKNKQETIDYQRAQRERQAAQAVAMVLVGFPIYWLHWSLIKRDRKRELV
ncbi:MAG TPA: DUF5671 domain-containing protein [Patescibacteria group bacterium]|nr:DUF5671 domain-containing protein [Patescibacteria group bacterium]